MKNFICSCVILVLSSFFSFTACIAAIHHKNILREYLQVRGGARKPKTHDRAYRMNVCDELLKVNSFFYLPPQGRQPLRINKALTQQMIDLHNLQRREPTSSTESDRLESRERRVATKSNVVYVEAFLCAEIENSELYATFTFQEGYFFLLTKSKDADDVDLKFRAMILPSPSLNVELSRDREKLERYFWEFLNKVPGPAHPRHVKHHTFSSMHLGCLPHYEHKYATVCSLIADLLSRNHDYDGLQLDIQKINYIRKIDGSSQCKRKTILDIKNDFLAIAMVLPCALNREWSRPQFYLLRDFLVPTSLFVLWQHGQYREQLSLLAFVDNVHILSRIEERFLTVDVIF